MTQRLSDFWVGFAAHGAQNRLVVLDAKVLILRKFPVGLSGSCLELTAEVFNKFLSSYGNPRPLSVACNRLLVHIPRNKLLPIVPEFVAGGQAQVTRF